MNILVADFETTRNQDKPEVYAWGIKGEGVAFHYGVGISSFIEFIETLKDDYVVFFHNGSKFDNHFLIYGLTMASYEQQGWLPNKKAILELKTSQYKASKTQTDLEDLKPKQFSLFADGNKKIFNIKLGVKWFKKRLKRPRHCVIEFRDTNLLFPNSIKGYGKMLNKYHNTYKYSKLELDTGYTRNKLYKNIKEFEEDGNELQYLEQDVEILWEFTKMIQADFPARNWKLTAASTAYNEWVKIFGQSKIDEYLKKKIVERKRTNNSTDANPHYFYKWPDQKRWQSSTKMSKSIIERILPIKWMNKAHPDGHITISQHLYNWYKGGITTVNPDYKALPLEGDLAVSVDDINSSYPSVMMQSMFPYGTPKKTDHKNPKYPFKLMTITAKCDIINKSGLPFLARLTGTAYEYTRQIKKGEIFYITSPEWERVQEHYEGTNKRMKECWNVKINYSFRQASGSVLFGDYIEYYYSLKSSSKQQNKLGLVVIAKLMLNSLYGKYASKTEKDASIWNDKTLEWEKEATLNQSQFYFPMGLAITSYARMKLVDAVGTNYKYFVYCDTDSIFYIDAASHFFKHHIDPNELGAWDREYTRVEGIVRRPKQYLFKTDNGYKSAFAGIYFKENQPSFSQFLKGTGISGQLRPVRTPTGVFLQETEKTIFPVWKYQASSEDWFWDKESFINNMPSQIKKLKERLDEKNKSTSDQK